MRVLALDLSTCAGVAVVGHSEDRPKDVIYGSTIQFKKLTGMERIHAIAAEVLSVHAQYKPQFVVVEDYAVSRFGGSAIVSISIGSVIRFLLWQQDIPYLEVSPTSLKKFVTGKGNAKKDQMILEVFKRYGYTSKTNDIADAVGLGMFGLCAAGVKFTVEAKKCVDEALKNHTGLPIPALL